MLILCLREWPVSGFPVFGLVVPSRELHISFSVVIGKLAANKVVCCARGVLVVGIEEELGAVATHRNPLAHAAGDVALDVGGLDLLGPIAR